MSLAVTKSTTYWEHALCGVEFELVQEPLCELQGCPQVVVVVVAAWDVVKQVLKACRGT